MAHAPRRRRGAVEHEAHHAERPCATGAGRVRRRDRRHRDVDALFFMPSNGSLLRLQARRHRARRRFCRSMPGTRRRHRDRLVGAGRVVAQEQRGLVVEIESRPTIGSPPRRRTPCTPTSCVDRRVGRGVGGCRSARSGSRRPCAAVAWSYAGAGAAPPQPAGRRDREDEQPPHGSRSSRGQTSRGGKGRASAPSGVGPAARESEPPGRRLPATRAARQSVAR